MYPSVAVAFIPSVLKGEGKVRWPYLDEKGLVTYGIGILGDGGAKGKFLSEPWKIEAPGLGARAATNAEIEAAWQAVKSHQEWKGYGGGNAVWQGLTDLRLDDDGIQNATESWLQQSEPTLRQHFPGYDTMPADAQLALLGMSYAMGPAFAQGYPAFAAAINSVVPNYVTAANESAINKNVNSAIADHNATNRQLFLNAANAMRSKTPFSQLWWPDNTDPGGTMALSFAANTPSSVRRFVTPGRVVAAAAVAGVAVMGVQVGLSVARGEGWQEPFRRIERGAERFGRSVDAGVRRLLPKKGEGA
jgi:hypothetical protein